MSTRIPVSLPDLNLTPMPRLALIVSRFNEEVTGGMALWHGWVSTALRLLSRIFLRPPARLKCRCWRRHWLKADALKG